MHYHRGEERAAALAAEIGGAPIAQADLTVEDDVDQLFATAREKLGSVDVCAAVAGVWPAVDLPVWELPLARWEETIRQNLTATFLTARAFLREVARTGHGSLVLVGSTAGRFGEAGHADYAAAKSALQGGLLLSLKNEVARVAPRAQGQRGRSRLDRVADDTRPRRRGGRPPHLEDDGAAQGGSARGHRGPGGRRSRRTFSPATSAASWSRSPAAWKAASSTTTPPAKKAPGPRASSRRSGRRDTRSAAPARRACSRRARRRARSARSRAWCAARAATGGGARRSRPRRAPARGSRAPPTRVGAEPVAELDRVPVEEHPDSAERRICLRVRDDQGAGVHHHQARQRQVGIGQHQPRPHHVIEEIEDLRQVLLRACRMTKSPPSRGSVSAAPKISRPSSAGVCPIARS